MVAGPWLVCMYSMAVCICVFWNLTRLWIDGEGMDIEGFWVLGVRAKQMKVNQVTNVL